MPILFFSPLTAVAVGPAGPPSLLTASIHSSPSTAIAISSNVGAKETDFQWLLIGLAVPSGTKIKGVEVCYQVLGGKRTYISQVRLTEMTTPNVATVRHDDTTNLTSTAPVCYQSKANSFVVAGTITLGLKIVLAKSEKILLGAVGLHT